MLEGFLMFISVHCRLFKFAFNLRLCGKGKFHFLNKNVLAKKKILKCYHDSCLHKVN